MNLITVEGGRLKNLSAERWASGTDGFRCGLPALDDLLPSGSWPRAGVHEFIEETHAMTPATWIASRAAGTDGMIAVCDPFRQFYPPFVTELGMSVDRLVMVYPETSTELLWAIAECLRCGGVKVVLAWVDRMSSLEARRLQLAAEDSGATAILVRPAESQRGAYAARTRWLVRGLPGDPQARRYRLRRLIPAAGPGAECLLEYRDGRFAARTCPMLRLEHQEEHESHALHSASLLEYRSPRPASRPWAQPVAV